MRPQRLAGERLTKRIDPLMSVVLRRVGLIVLKSLTLSVAMMKALPFAIQCFSFYANDSIFYLESLLSTFGACSESKL